MNVLDKLMNNWNYQIGYVEDGVFKVYRCMAESRSEAESKFLDNTSPTPKEYEIMNRQEAEDTLEEAVSGAPNGNS